MKHYEKQLREFKKHMDTCFDVLMNSDLDDGTHEIFYNSEFTITWRGKTVTLYNGAEVFQGIEEIIDTETGYYEEEI